MDGGIVGCFVFGIALLFGAFITEQVIPLIRRIRR